MPPRDVAPGAKPTVKVRPKPVGNPIATITHVVVHATRPAATSDVQSGGANQIQRANVYKRTSNFKTSVGAAKPARKTDVTSSGPGYGVARANRFKATPIPQDQPLFSLGPVHLGHNVIYKDYAGKDITNQVVAQGKAAAASRRPTGGLNRALDDVGSALGKPAGAVMRDYANTEINFIPATAHLVSTAVTGHPLKAGKQLIEPYKQFIKDPVGSFKRNPVATSLLVSGPLQGATRGLGAVARRGTLGDAAKSAASTTRAPLVLEHARLARPQTYSRDPVVKTVQVALEKNATRKATKAGVPTGRVSEAQVKTRVNQLEGINQAVARAKGQQVSLDVKHAVRNKENTTGQPRAIRRAVRARATPIKPVEGATSLIAQNIVKPTRESLRGYLEHVKAQHPTLEGHDQALNEQLQGQIQSALDGKTDLGKVAQAAQKYAGVERPITQKLEQYKILDPRQTAKRRELPYAVSPVQDLHAVRDTTPRLTSTGVAKYVTHQERQVKAREYQSARVAESQAKTEFSQAVAKAQATEARQGGLSLKPTPPRSMVVGRKVRAKTSADVNDMLTFMNRAEKNPALVKRPARGQPPTPAPADQVLRAIQKVDEAKARTEAARQAGIDARQAHVTAKKAGVGKPDKRAPGFVDPTGRPLSTGQIRAERQAAGLGEPAYVSHAPNLTNRGSFYRHYSEPVSAGTRRFTGGSILKGTVDASNEVLHANARKLQSLASAHEGYTRTLDELGMRNQKGLLLTKRTREDMQKQIDSRTLDARGNPVPGARKWRIVRVTPFHAGSERVAGLLEDTAHTGDHPQPILDSIHEALNGEGAGHFAAIPEVAAQQIQAHVRVLGSQVAPVFNVVNSLFRRNVLAFNPKWGFGNVAEATFRSVIAGVRPGDRVLYRNALAQVAQDDARAAETLMGSVGHGHYGFVLESTRHTTPEEFASMRFIAPIAKTLDKLGHTKGLEWVPTAYRAYTGYVFGKMAMIEDQFRQGIAGAYIRKNILDAGVDKTAERAILDAAKGLQETPAQIGLLEYVQKSYGQYEGWSPQMRLMMQSYTPFLAWTLNAANFLLHVLPKDHPVLMGLMADVYLSQQDWLKKVGLDVGSANALPSYLLGSAITGNGGAIRIARYTPPGLWQDPLNSAATLVLPQFRDIQMAFQGLDPFGQPLKESKLTAVAKGVMSIIVPAGSQLGNIAAGNGSLTSRLNQNFNPVAETPASKVQYARAKQSLTNIQNEIKSYPQAKRQKDAQGFYPQPYQRLLNKQSDLTYERNRLLVQSGLKKDPALEVSRQVELVNRQLQVMERQGKAVDQYGYATKDFQALRNQRNALERQRAKLVHKAKGNPIKARPLSAEDQLRQQIKQLRQGASPEGIKKQLRDEMNRLHEQAKVARGG